MDIIKNRCMILIFLGMSIVCASSTVIAAARRTMLGVNTVTSLYPVVKWIVMNKRELSALPEASPFYRRYFDEALRSYGISNPEKITLKNNSSLSEDIGGAATMAGVMLNEKELNQLGIAWRIYVCYHEAAHLALKHTHKDPTLQLAAATSASCLVGSYLVCNNTKLQIAFIPLALLGIKLVSQFKYQQPPWNERPIEKEADAMAIKHLIKNGHHDVVERIYQEYQDRCNKAQHDLDSYQKKLKDMGMGETERNALVDVFKKNFSTQKCIGFTRWKMLSEQASAEVRREQAVRSKL